MDPLPKSKKNGPPAIDTGFVRNYNDYVYVSSVAYFGGCMPDENGIFLKTPAESRKI